MLILLVCGDIESNPGPKRLDSYNNFAVCHWNLNSMTACNFGKVNFLATYIAFDNDNLNIKGYNLYRADHHNHVKKGGASSYIREPLLVRCLSNTYLQECLLL